MVCLALGQVTLSVNHRIAAALHDVETVLVLEREAHRITLTANTFVGVDDTVVSLHAGVVSVGRGGGVFVDFGVLQGSHDTVVDRRTLAGEAVVLPLGKKGLDLAVHLVRKNEVANKSEVPSVMP